MTVRRGKSTDNDFEDEDSQEEERIDHGSSDDSPEGWQKHQSIPTRRFRRRVTGTAEAVHNIESNTKLCHTSQPSLPETLLKKMSDMMANWIKERQMKPPYMGASKENTLHMHHRTKEPASWIEKSGAPLQVKSYKLSEYGWAARLAVGQGKDFGQFIV